MPRSRSLPDRFARFRSERSEFVDAWRRARKISHVRAVSDIGKSDGKDTRTSIGLNELLLNSNSRCERLLARGNARPLLAPSGATMETHAEQINSSLAGMRLKKSRGEIRGANADAGATEGSSSHFLMTRCRSDRRVGRWRTRR